MTTSAKTLVVFCAQNGPLISRRLDQLPVAPALGVVFNFDNEYYQQVQAPMVCFGRTATGASRDLNVMMFGALSVLHSPAEVAEILKRRYVSYSVPETDGGSTIIMVKDKLDNDYEDLMLVQCKRLHAPGLTDVSQFVRQVAED